MKISEKEAVSPVIGVILMVAITVVLAAVLYVWVSSMAPSGGGTPYCSLNPSTSGTESGQTFVNVSWMVSAPSRSDIKWADVPNASAKYIADGTVLTGITVTYPTSTYVTGGDIIKAQLTRGSTTTATTVKSGAVVKLVLVHTPSGGTLAESSITVSYTT